MARGGTVNGVSEVIGSMNTKLKQIEGLSMAGLYKGALLVQRRSQKLIPVDTGNLRASAYVRRAMLGGNSVEIGYTASYAAAVHELVGQKLKGEPRDNFGKTSDGIEFGGGTGKGTYWETGEPKFLEKALYASEKDILELAQDSAKKATR